MNEMENSLLITAVDNRVSLSRPLGTGQGRKYGGRGECVGSETSFPVSLSLSLSLQAVYI